MADHVYDQGSPALDGPVDAIRPWTIKSVANETREAVITAARMEGLTVGQWLERQMRGYAQVGRSLPQSVQLSPVVSPAHQASLDAAVQAAGLVKQLSDIPGLPESVLRSAYTLLRERLRAARGS